MNIEEEIQSSFSDEYHKGLVNLIYTHNFLLDRMNEEFKKVDITRQQFNVLRILKGQFPKPAPISTIKDRMLDKMSDASRIVERLEKKELVKKQIAEHDRRAVDVIITDKGIEMLTNFSSESEKFNDMMRCLDEEEIQKFNHILDKIRTYSSLNK